MQTVVWLIPTAVVLTSTLSGIFGMGGGMILMGVYALLLPVSHAMILHGATQLAANGFRCCLFWRHVYWRGLGGFGLGACLSLCLIFWSRLVLDKTSLFLMLGTIPFLGYLPRLPRLTFTRHRQAFFCGLLVTGSQLTAGVSGPLLDIFFLEGDLNRFQVIATKAFTQSFGHLFKLIYFGSIIATAEGGDGLPFWIFPAVIVLSMGGTYLGKRILARISEHGFLKGSRVLVLFIGCGYLAKGLSGLLA